MQRQDQKGASEVQQFNLSSSIETGPCLNHR
jgi:hypothetical protein